MCFLAILIRASTTLTWGVQICLYQHYIYLWVLPPPPPPSFALMKGFPHVFGTWLQGVPSVPPPATGALELRQWFEVVRWSGWQSAFHSIQNVWDGIEVRAVCTLLTKMSLYGEAVTFPFISTLVRTETKKKKVYVDILLALYYITGNICLLTSCVVCKTLRDFAKAKKNKLLQRQI